MHQLRRLFSFKLCDSIVIFDELRRTGNEVAMAFFSVRMRNLRSYGPNQVLSGHLLNGRCITI
jgi:hypothetical protein